MMRGIHSEHVCACAHVFYVKLFPVVFAHPQVHECHSLWLWYLNKSHPINTEERNCAAMPVTQVVATLPNTEDQVCATATQTSGQGSAAGVQQEWVACSVSNLTSIYVPPQFVSILRALDIEMQGVLHDCACC